MKKHEKKSKGGSMKGESEKAKPNVYNAKGSPEEKEAMDDKDGFKRGGKKRAEGGSVYGTKSAVRLDKRARGGAMKSPYSSAESSEMPSKQSSGKGSGHEDEQPSDMA